MTDEEIGKYGWDDVASSLGTSAITWGVDEIGKGYTEIILGGKSFWVYIGGNIDFTDYGAVFFRHFNPVTNDTVEYSFKNIIRPISNKMIESISENPIIVKRIISTSDFAYAPISIIVNTIPSQLSNIFNNAPVEEYVADFTIDTGGWTLSTTAGIGTTIGVAALFSETGPLAVPIGIGAGLVVENVVGLGYDATVTKFNLSEKLEYKLKTNFEENMIPGVPILCPNGCPNIY